MDPDSVIEELGLVPHPEGGHYRETWADPTASAIFFLLRAGQRSAWHRVLGRTELWHFYAGAPLLLHTSPEGTGSRTVLLGPQVLAGQRPQAVVAPGCWQSAETTGGWTLAGCTVSPRFSFDAFELAPEGWAP